MYIAQKHNLIEDLSSVLINNYQQLNVKYCFYHCDDFEAYEIFDYNSLLFMFLYDKQKFLNKFCFEVLKNNIHVDLVFENLDSFNSKKHFDSGYTFIKVSLKHNIKKLEDYHKTLKFLSLLITTDPSLSIHSDNSINIDPIYKKFIKDCELKKFIPKERKKF